MRTISYPAFTLVEIIVVITILTILSSIGFFSYSKYIDSARDSKRQTDISSLESALSLYKRQRGVYPHPSGKFEIQNGTYVVAYQGVMDNTVALPTTERVPTDPKAEVPYSYSITRNRQDFELVATLENGGFPLAYLRGTYKTISKNLLPTISVATNANINISTITNKGLFIFDNQGHNLPYRFTASGPYSDATPFSTLLAESAGSLIQNSDLETCGQIFLAQKQLSDNGSALEYQLRDANGNLGDQNCSCTTTDCT